MTDPYVMSIEEFEGYSKLYGFHLGTDKVLARKLIKERFTGRVKANMPTVTIALMQSGKLIDVYDGKWAND